MLTIRYYELKSNNQSGPKYEAVDFDPRNVSSSKRYHNSLIWQIVVLLSIISSDDIEMKTCAPYGLVNVAVSEGTEGIYEQV